MAALRQAAGARIMETESQSQSLGHNALDKLLPKSLSTRRKHRSKNKKKHADDQDAAVALESKRRGDDDGQPNNENDDDEHQYEQRGRHLSARNQSTDSDDTHSARLDDDAAAGADARSFVSDGSSTDIDLSLVES